MSGLGDGSYVTSNGINNNLQMMVIDVDTVKDEALCVLAEGVEQWIPIDQLTLVKEAPNGFDL